MAGPANLGDSRVVEELLRCLYALPGIVDRALAEAETEAAPRIARFERALDAAHDEVREAERALDAAEDEDARWQEDRLEEARAHLSRMEAAGDDLLSALSDYRSAASDLSSLDREALTPARDFLEGRLQALADYEALRPDGRPSAGAREQAAPALSEAAAPAVVAPLAAALPPLPGGYAWIPIAGLPSEPELEWGAGRATIEQGLRTFAAELLPRLRDGLLSRDDLVEFDRANGRDEGGLVYPDSLANVRDMFFGSEPVAVSPLPGGSFDVTNGRHRIEAARALGWTHLPARLIGPSR